MIGYRKIDYIEHSDYDDVIGMYKRVFNIDFGKQYEFLFRSDHYDRPVGVIAFDEENGKAVGHFTTVSMKAIINGKSRCFRMSMGFMTDPDYRGQGIATDLYHELKKLILLEEEDNMFIIGFPNDNSFHMHIDRMEYHQFRTFSFVELPSDRRVDARRFKRIERIKTEKINHTDEGYNRISHDDSFLDSRYADGKYEKYLSEDGKLYICTGFRDKMDILYWSDFFDEEGLLDFAAFLHGKEGVNRVTTWNSADYLNKYQAETREYHMCFNYLDRDDDQISEINEPWIFYMGDCELF